MNLVAINLTTDHPISQDSPRRRPRPMSVPQQPSIIDPINVTIPRVTVTLPFNASNQTLGIWFASLQYPEYFTDDKIKPIDPATLTNTSGVIVVDLDNTDSFIQNYLRHVNHSSLTYGQYTVDKLSKLPGDKIVVSSAGDVLEGTSEIYSKYLADSYEEQGVDPYSQDYPRTIFVFNKHGEDIRVFMLNGMGYTFNELVVTSPVERINDLELFWNVLQMQPVKGIDVKHYLKIHDAEMYDRIIECHKYLLQLHLEEQLPPFTSANDEGLEELVSLNYHSSTSDKGEMVNCKLYHHKDHGLLISLDDDNLAIISLTTLLTRRGIDDHIPNYLRPRF